jgi:hypothetical protein
MEIKYYYYTTSNHGKKAMYILGKGAGLVSILTRRVTLSDKDIEALIGLGCNLIEVLPPKYLDL